MVHGCKAFLPLMKRADAGCVINVSSVYGLNASPMQRAKVVLHAKSESTQVLECKKMQAWFYTSVEQTVTDMLVGVTKGKIRIHVGRGAGWFDWLSRLLPVSYSRLF
jgi:NAD(P)-dependent dehydrogenase (short-subunit alcohol dehydrogenase family)